MALGVVDGVGCSLVVVWCGWLWFGWGLVWLVVVWCGWLWLVVVWRIKGVFGVLGRR